MGDDRRQESIGRRESDRERELELSHWRGVVDESLKGVKDEQRRHAEKLGEIQETLAANTVQVEKTTLISKLNLQETRNLRYGLYTLAFGAVGLAFSAVLGHLP